MDFRPNFLTTHVGSLPHPLAEPICRRLMNDLDIPCWPQLPRRTFHENMYVQYSSGLPGLVLDETNEHIYFDTHDLPPVLEAFYQRCLDDDLDSFGFQSEWADGFFTLLNLLKDHPPEWVKGQVTGPISFGLTVADQNQRASLYSDELADVIVKNTTMKARWQVRQLRTICPNVLMSVDEPYMASFGSAYINLGRAEVIGMLDEVFSAIHQEGALASVHCCGNTDWSVLLSTAVDILNLDAFNYLETLSLYPNELAAFIQRGGVIAWGIVPNSEQLLATTSQQLAGQLWQGLELICARAQVRGLHLRPSDLASQSLLAPACGLGSTSPDLADRALAILCETARLVRRG
jgi:hypothetical protein